MARRKLWAFFLINGFLEKALAVEAPRFGKGSGAKEDSSPASIKKLYQNHFEIVMVLL